MNEIALQSSRFNVAKIRSTVDLISRFSAVAVGLALPISTTFTEIFFYAAVFLSFCAGTWWKNCGVILRSRIGIMLVIMYGLFIVGLTYTSAPWHQAISELIKYNKLLLGALIMPLFVEKKWRDYALYAFLVAMTFVMLSSYAMVIKSIYLHGSYQTASVFKGHIQQNFLIALSAYLFAEMAIVYKRWLWLFVPLALLAVFNALFLSIGRSGYVTLGLLMMLFLWQNLGIKGIFVAIISIALLAVMAFFISSSFHQRINATLQNYQRYQQGQVTTSIGARLSFAKNGFKVFMKHPWVGTGTGSFIREYKALNPPQNEMTTNPHNEDLNIGVQFGVVGIVWLLLLFYVGWRESVNLSPQAQRIARGVILSIGIGCLINSWLMDITEGYAFVYFMAITFSGVGLAG